MKTNAGLKIFLLGLMTVLLAGCATSHVDWNARIGNYTYDEAVIELGPPDKMARLTDGKVVADWITHYNTPSTVFVGGGIYPGQVGMVQTVGPNNYVDILRLTFDTHQILCAWVKK